MEDQTRKAKLASLHVYPRDSHYSVTASFSLVNDYGGERDEVKLILPESLGDFIVKGCMNEIIAAIQKSARDIEVSLTPLTIHEEVKQIDNNKPEDYRDDDGNDGIPF